MESISNRLKKAMEIRGVTQAELVKKTGIGKSSISTYLSGEYEPKQRNTYKLAQALNINEAWLMGLDVDIERKNNVKALTNKEFILLKSFNKLNNIGKNEAQKRVDELTLIDKYNNLDDECIINEYITEVAARGDSEKKVKIKKSDIEKDLENYTPPDKL